MDDNQNNKSTFTVVDYSDKKEKKNYNFTKSVFVPFCSGILGTALVIGTCFGVPGIRDKIVNNSNGNESSTVLTSTSRR